MIRRAAPWAMLLVLVLAGCGSPPDVKEILTRADTAIKAVDSVRMTANAVPEGVATNFFAPTEGTALLVGWTGNIPQKFHAEVETSRPGEDVRLRLTGGGDGDTYFIIDHGAKQGYEDMDPLVLGSGGNALQAMSMAEFVHPAPFEDELNAEDAKLLGTQMVGDEECYEIHVVYSGGMGESTWYFAKSDYLPRRRVQHFSFNGVDGKVDRTITKLELDPEFDASLFKMDLPEGYEQIDDFYP